MRTRKQTNEATLMFLPPQDEMEGLDLEGKTVEETTDLLEKLFRAGFGSIQSLTLLTNTSSVIRKPLFSFHTICVD